MPSWSEERQVWLQTKEECAALFGVSKSTIRDKLKNPNCWSITASPSGRGRPVLLIDPTTLGLRLPEGASVCPKIGISDSNKGQSRDFLSEIPTVRVEQGLVPASPASLGRFSDSQTLSENVRYSQPLTADVLHLHQSLQPLLATSKNSRQRGEAVRAYAAAQGVTDKQVYRWLAALEANDGPRNSPYALMRQQRADKGRLRLPAEVRDLIVAAYLNNKPGVSANAIHRALLRSVPEALAYATKGGSTKRVEPWTVVAVEKELRADPVLQLIFKDGTQRKEFLRVYNGKVRALHANWQWQIDMTRCDTEVYDPVTGEFYRLRIHSVIDVFSGCIMGLSFSREENTLQTKIALLRALTPKQGRFAHLYPMYGTPNTIYWDNGKTYVCEETERIVAHLGIESVHSMPRVSHTRGKVERQFGTFHQMIERTLPGYVGEDAVNRDSEELKALRERTLRWQATGRDPGRPNRHLTPEEFKSIALMWLLTEYHQMMQPSGLTREEMFRASVEAEAKHTLRLYNQTDLFYLFAKRSERVVTPDSGILYQGRIFKSPSGALAGYAGRRVLLLEDAFSPEGWYGVMYQLQDGTLRDLGDVYPASEWADSAESAQTRKLEKAKRRELVEDFKAIRGRAFKPELEVAQSLINALPPALDDPDALPVIDVEPLPQASHRARLALTERAEDVPNFGFTHKGADAQTADEFMAAVKSGIPRRKK